ncbi:MAG: glycosyltransferase family 39 protein [Candidatus Acidiferrum sp.]
MPVKRTWMFSSLVILGILVRLGFVLAADAKQFTFHSGGSDAPAYVLLAENLISHQGFSYGGQPSAFRPPGYPLILAAFMKLFGQNYISAMRWLQFFAGLLTVGICGLLSRRICGTKAAQASVVFGLFLPTLIFSTDQLLTECLSALLTALFLRFLVDQIEKADTASAVGIGLVAGLESLIRFNAAALPLFGLLAIFWTRHKRSVLLRTAAITLLPLYLVAPWFIRNEMVFHGRVLFSTHGGANAVQGVVTTQGRTQPGDSERLMAAMGWTLSQLETNDPVQRISLPSEVELNRRAREAVPRLWKAEGWHTFPLLVMKTADFWLSADQLLDTSSLPIRERLTRAAGVLCYLMVLAFAVGGLYQLRKARPEVALTFLIYAVGYTILHLMLVMNTRLRIPLMEPLLVVLAGIGWDRFSLLLNRNHGREQHLPADAGARP